MKNKFLIIGLSGPLGSGCSTIASFLEKQLSGYKSTAKTNVSKITTQMNNYYRHLKTIQTERISNIEQFANKFNDIDTNPEQLVQYLTERNNTRKFGNTTKILNKKLRDLVIKRHVYDYYSREKWPNFTRISLSEVIFKILLEKCVDQNGKTEPQFEGYSCGIEEKGKELLISSAIKHRQTIVKFNRTIDSK